MDLKISFPNFRELRKILKRKKNLLMKRDKAAPDYKEKLKDYFEMLIFVKAHALSLDTKMERQRLLSLLMKELEYLKLC